MLVLCCPFFFFQSEDFEQFEEGCNLATTCKLCNLGKEEEKRYYAVFLDYVWMYLVYIVFGFSGFQLVVIETEDHSNYISIFDKGNGPPQDCSPSSFCIPCRRALLELFFLIMHLNEVFDGFFCFRKKITKKVRIFCCSCFHDYYFLFIDENASIFENNLCKV